MRLLVAFMFGVMALSTWELRGGPKWRNAVALLVCALVAGAFMFQRVVET